MTGITSVVVPCKSADIAASKGGTLEVTLYNPDSGDILDLFDPAEVVSHFGEEKMLKEILSETARVYYDFPTDDGSDEIESLENKIAQLEEERDELKEEIKNLNSRGSDYIKFDEA
jgi:hypothetical protein